MQRQSKKPFVLLGLIISAVIGLVYGVSYWVSLQKLEIQFDQSNLGINASIYSVPGKDGDGNPINFIDRNRLVGEATGNKSFKLKKGLYVVSTSGNNDFGAQSQTINLGSKPETIHINPKYTDNKLAELLGQEKATLQAAIKNSFPKTISGYDIGNGKLYDQGEWYGTTLVIKQTEEQRRLGYTDTYRLVAHKENGVWKIVTVPPELAFSSSKYPNIPKSLLVEINKLQP